MNSENREFENFRIISDDDLDLYRRMGYKLKPGRLEFVSQEEREVDYSTWDDLISFSSPWVEYLRDYQDVLTYWVDAEGLDQSEKDAWCEVHRDSQKFTLDKLKAADSIKIPNVSLSKKNCLPQDVLDLYTDDIVSHVTNIGMLINAVLPVNHENLLTLANSRPLGREGGYQQLSNILGKKIIGQSGRLKVEFLPSGRLSK